MSRALSNKASSISQKKNISKMFQLISTPVIKKNVMSCPVVQTSHLKRKVEIFKNLSMLLELQKEIFQKRQTRGK